MAERYKLSNYYSMDAGSGLYDLDEDNDFSRELLNLPTEVFNVPNSGALSHLEYVSDSVYGVSELWWVLAVVNTVSNPLDLTNVSAINYPLLRDVEDLFIRFRRN